MTTRKRERLRRIPRSKFLIVAHIPIDDCVADAIARTMRVTCHDDIYDYLDRETRGLRFDLAAAIVREDQHRVRYFQRCISTNEWRLAMLRAGGSCG